MAVVEDKISFILYGSYEEQLDMLTDEQAGKLFKAIYVYARTGEKHSDDPMVAMMLSVIGHQMDIDARKYMEKKERLRAAGRKGGKQKAANVAKANEIVANASHAINCVANLAVDVDDDVDVLDIYSGDGGKEVVDAHKVITIFDEYPSTQAELDKFTALADELFVRYGHRQPTRHDLAKVFEYSHGIYYYTDDDRIVVLNEEKAQLLRYAFKTAANADKLHWSYIEGIFANFRSRGITCMEDVYRDNWEYYYGPVSA